MKNDMDGKMIHRTSNKSSSCLTVYGMYTIEQYEKNERERDDEKREREELDDRDDTMILKENQKDIIKQQKGQQDKE